jgi:aryl-alcohol dehydrogenase-like predicted oxidoreductase
MHARDIDRMKAKARMRRRRAEGITLFDAARHYALKSLRVAHPEEFDYYRGAYLRTHGRRSA